jgi:hypothetical protein
VLVALPSGSAIHELHGPSPLAGSLPKPENGSFTAGLRACNSPVGELSPLSDVGINVPGRDTLDAIVVGSGPNGLAAEINARKPAMKRLLQTHDTRTVRRHLARLKKQAPALGITQWVTTVEAKLPRLICSVGSARLLSTTNAIERFFRAFQRFYATRGGFHSVLSAKRELLLFLVVYVFTQHAVTGQAPIEVIIPEARLRPLYGLINDPFRALQEHGHVKPEANTADLLRVPAAAA